jgi:cell wall-associated NlpC family hydrolase
VSRFDPRLTLARADLAASGLEGILPAARYAAATPMACVVPAAGLAAAPSTDAELKDQLLFGERFEVLEVQGGWAWGQAPRDGYVGYVRAEALAPPGPAPTHRVAALCAAAYVRPEVTAPVSGVLTLNALVAAGGADGRFAEVAGLGWIAARHLAPIGTVETDLAGVAERFVGAAYVWGGREARGIDCSGLVLQAMLALGRACPRDTDLQATLGAPVQPDALRRGDLVFWPGHVAIMLDEARVVHANGHHAATVVEPLSQVVARYDAAGARPVAYRRL